MVRNTQVCLVPVGAVATPPFTGLEMIFDPTTHTETSSKMDLMAVRRKGRLRSKASLRLLHEHACTVGQVGRPGPL